MSAGAGTPKLRAGEQYDVDDNKDAAHIGCGVAGLAAGCHSPPSRSGEIGVFVQPFYESGRTPGEPPQVSVGQQYNELLSSNRRENILAARDLIAAKPAVVTPMAMMVLAIRLYDVGLRDDAVFWFYVAKERYIVMSEVLDVKSPALAQADDAVRSFSTLAGPVINGYAFCDLANKKNCMRRRSNGSPQILMR